MERRVYTAGKNKVDPFKEEKDDIKRLKTIQLELHEDFIKMVKDSRGPKLKDPEKNNIFTGEFGLANITQAWVNRWIRQCDQVLKDKFGEKDYQKFRETKGFHSKKIVFINPRSSRKIQI